MIDFLRIWNSQTLSPELEEQIILTCREVFDFITRDDRTTLNVTEWCKKEDCWKRAQNYNFTLLENFVGSLISSDNELDEKEVAQKSRR